MLSKRHGVAAAPATRAMPNDFVAASGDTQFDLKYFLSGALAGGICCSITHGALTPVDVVKTRIQLDSAKYNKGMVQGFKQIAAEEGSGALLTGLGPTAVGYFIQGVSHLPFPSRPTTQSFCPECASLREPARGCEAAAAAGWAARPSRVLGGPLEQDAAKPAAGRFPRGARVPSRRAFQA